MRSLTSFRTKPNGSADWSPMSQLFWLSLTFYPWILVASYWLKKPQVCFPKVTYNRTFKVRNYVLWRLRESAPQIDIGSMLYNSLSHISYLLFLLFSCIGDMSKTVWACCSHRWCTVHNYFHRWCLILQATTSLLYGPVQVTYPFTKQKTPREETKTEPESHQCKKIDQADVPPSGSTYTNG
jgi:hypothetical protein